MTLTMLLAIGATCFVAAWGIDWLAGWWAKESGYGIPVAPIVLSIVAMTFANFATPWVALGILALYAVVRAKEAIDTRNTASMVQASTKQVDEQSNA